MNKYQARILVVDDTSRNRELISEYLEPLGVLIDEACSGEECLQLIKKNEYTLIIMDVQMPGLDGFQVLEKIRSDDDLKAIPVVFVSAVFNSDEYILKGIEKGAIDFITKPVNINILQSKVNNFLKLYEKQIELDNLVKTLEVMNKRLENSEKRFKRITQSANDAIIVLDNDFCVRFWNKSANRIFGYSRYEILSENFIVYAIAPVSQDEFKGLTKNLLGSTERSLSNTTRLTGRKKDEMEFPIELSLSYFIDTDKQVNFTLVIRDITRRIIMEKEALKAKELRETNRVMKEFMDSVSHELRTPMNAILGISNMLLKYNADNLILDQREGLEIINQSGTRLLEMINDILDLSRLEENRMAVNLDHIELENFLTPFYSIMNSLIGQKKIRFHIMKSSSIPHTIFTDQKKLNQILTNLLGNSAKFTNEGKITLYVHQIQDKLYFEVSDTGIGIAEEHLEEIFERFRQLDNSATKEFKGTGLGLNICKKLIELLGGEIKAISTPGKGTTIKFYLPNQPVAEQSCKSTGTNIKQSGITYLIDPTAINRRLAVIITDNEELHYWYSTIFKNFNFNVITCISAREALRIISKFIPDIIVLKIEMNAIHGTAILKSVRKDQSSIHIPVLAVTNDTNLSFTNIDNPVILLQEPITEAMISESVNDLIKADFARVGADRVILYEQENHLGVFKREGDLIYRNENLDTSIIFLSRRSINTLVFDDIDLSGENLKLLKWLQENHEFLPERLVVVTSSPFKYITDELGKIQNSYFLSINTIIKLNSLDDALTKLKQ